MTDAGAPARSGFPWADLVAGLSIAGLLLPEAVAYSGIASLPPQAGIIALFAGLACYALLGRSRFAIVSATSSSAAVLGAATATLASGDPALRIALAAGLVLITGTYFLLASAARLGSVTDFISKPVLRGFSFGLAIVIIVRQCGTLLGVHAAGGDILSFTLDLLRQSAAWNHTSLMVGASALVLLFALARLPHVPGGLIVIALGIASTHWLDLPAYAVGVVGPIRLELHAPSVPVLDRNDWLRLGELGIALVLVLYSESYGSIRSFAIKYGDPVSPDRDLAALGAANLMSGLFLGMPVGAGYSATSANEAAGARSRWAGVVAAAALLLVAAFILSSIALTPEPVLAAIVIHAVSHSLNPSVFRRYFIWQRDRFLVGAAVVAVLWLGVLDGLLVAIAISLMLMLRRVSVSTVAVLGRLGHGHDFVDVTKHPDARPVDDILILRPDEPLFFANVERVLAEVRRRVMAAGEDVRCIVLSLEETYDLDSSSMEAFQEFFAWSVTQHKGLVLARLKQPVRDMLARIVTPGAAAPVLIELSVDDAVQTAEARPRTQGSP